MGSATAYYLTKADPALKVAVVERDPSYARASTTLSMSNVRIQFSLKENIQISQYAFQVLERFEEEMAVEDRTPRIYFHREGNLFLVGEQNLAAARRAFDLQRSLGCRIEWWSPDEIKQHYPLYETARTARRHLRPRRRAFRCLRRPDGLQGQGQVLRGGLSDRRRRKDPHRRRPRHQHRPRLGRNTRGRVRGQLRRRLGGRSRRHRRGQAPGRPRQAPDLHARHGGEARGPAAADHPALRPILPHRDRRYDPAGEIHGRGPGRLQLGWDDQRFMELLWPELAEFVSAWERLKLVRGWAGLYDVNTLDHNAIIGEWPEIRGLYLATGFSGHGLQQGPAVSRYLSELILNRPPALDLSIFTPARVLENTTLQRSGNSLTECFVFGVWCSERSGQRPGRKPRRKPQP